MRTLTYQRAHRLGKLQAELLAAIPAFAPVNGPLGPEAVILLSGDGTTFTLQVPDATDDNAVQAVVDAHDATTPGAYEQQQTAEATNESAIRDALLTALATLENTVTWPPRTQAEKIEILRRAEVRLIRLLLRRLDATG